METPENFAYLVLGLLASGGIMAAFIASMMTRYRSLQQDIRVMDELAQDE